MTKFKCRKNDENQITKLGRFVLQHLDLSRHLTFDIRHLLAVQ